MTSVVTAYCLCALCTSFTHGVTFSGKHAEPGLTAACGPRLYGKVVFIEGLGSWFCEDKGSLVNGSHIDVLLSSHDKAVQFGRKKLKVRVIGDWRRNAVQPLNRK